MIERINPHARLQRGERERKKGRGVSRNFFPTKKVGFDFEVFDHFAGLVDKRGKGKKGEKKKKGGGKRRGSIHGLLFAAFGGGVAFALPSIELI